MSNPYRYLSKSCSDIYIIEWVTTFKPLGLKVSKQYIHASSLRLSKESLSPPLLGRGTWSSSINLRSLSLWPIYEKCLAMGKSLFFFRMVLWCWLHLALNSFLVSPIYSNLHGHHPICGARRVLSQFVGDTRARVHKALSFRHLWAHSLNRENYPHVKVPVLIGYLS